MITLILIDSIRWKAYIPSKQWRAIQMSETSDRREEPHRIVQIDRQYRFELV